MRPTHSSRSLSAGVAPVLPAALLAALAVTIAFPGQPIFAESHVFGSKSEVAVLTDRGGFLSFAGHRHTIKSNKISGFFDFDPVAIENASIELELDASSLRVADDDLSADDLAQVQKNMEEEVLEVAEFPEIRFRSTSVEDSKALDDGEFEIAFRGILTLHGKGKVVVIRTTISPVKAAWDSRVRWILKAALELKQKDYGIDPVSIGLGAVKVKNEVELTFRLEALASSHSVSPYK